MQILSTNSSKLLSHCFNSHGHRTQWILYRVFWVRSVVGSTNQKLNTFSYRCHTGIKHLLQHKSTFSVLATIVTTHFHCVRTGRGSLLCRIRIPWPSWVFQCFHHFLLTVGAILLCVSVSQYCTLPIVEAAVLPLPPPPVLVLAMPLPPVSPAHAVRPSGSPRRRT
jgi:hypothetical protein